MTPPERDRRSHVRARRGGRISALSLIPSALRSPPPPLSLLTEPHTHTYARTPRALCAARITRTTYTHTGARIMRAVRRAHHTHHKHTRARAHHARGALRAPRAPHIHTHARKLCARCAVRST